MRWSRLIAAGWCAALAACHTVPLAADPMSPRRKPAPIAVYEIEWWVPLVPPSLWEIGPREPASPGVDPATGTVVVATRDGFVRAMSIDGVKVWEFKTQGPFAAGPAVEEGVAYVPGGDGNLYALELETGKPLWTFAANEELVTTPVLLPDKVLVVSQADTLFAVDRETGKWAWQYRRDPPAGFTVRGASAPRALGETLFIGFADGYLVALSAADGVVRWERALSTSGGNEFLDVDTAPVVSDGDRVYAASYKDGIYALNAATGEVLWHSPRAGVTSLLPRGDVLFTTGDASVGAVARDSGRVLWSLDLEGRAGQPPALSKGLLVVPTGDALLFVEPASGRARVAWDPGEGVSATPTRSAQRLYVLSNRGTLYAMRILGGAG